MTIAFIPCTELQRAAELTFDNMRVYYAQYAPEWDVEKVLSATSKLINLDILLDEKVVGVMRLEYEDDNCVLRDLQIIPNEQNKGIGVTALQEAKRLALSANKNTLSLRVFKISPAVALYQRDGFVIKSEDDRFFNMVKDLKQ
ncbi:GNAT family N-acetyltransferase [Alteromonas marina]